MVKKVTPNGTRIKELRTNSLVERPQKQFAKQCGISERHLRRIENENWVTPVPVLQRIAKELAIGLQEIAFGTHGPMLVTQTKGVATSLDAATPEPGITVIPRYGTASLPAVSTAQMLYELAESSQGVIPHVLVDAPPAQLAMIKECLTLLKAVSDRQWLRSCGALMAADVHDSDDFPEISRRTRLAELFVLLKGHDIRVVAERETYHYPAGAKPWLKGQSFCFQLIIAFASPRGEYEEESVTVPFDQGREIVLSSEPLF